jgi:hypothetical protein
VAADYEADVRLVAESFRRKALRVSEHLIGFDRQILEEIANILPVEDYLVRSSDSAGGFLMEIYNQAPFIASWPGKELLGALKYIATYSRFTMNNIVSDLKILDKKKQSDPVGRKGFFSTRRASWL